MRELWPPNAGAWARRPYLADIEKYHYTEFWSRTRDECDSVAELRGGKPRHVRPHQRGLVVRAFVLCSRVRRLWRKISWYSENVGKGEEETGVIEADGGSSNLPCFPRGVPPRLPCQDSTHVSQVSSQRLCSVAALGQAEACGCAFSARMHIW